MYSIFTIYLIISTSGRKTWGHWVRRAPGEEDALYIERLSCGIVFQFRPYSCTFWRDRILIMLEVVELENMLLISIQ